MHTALLHPPPPPARSRASAVASNTADEPLAGTPYRTLATLGRGGMGEVFDTEHRMLKKRVVVKVLHAEYQGREDVRDRMRLEAQILAQLSHPNIVAVHDFGTTPAGRTYLVMERLWGETLRQRMKTAGAFPPREAVRIAIQALAGLQAAHTAGVIHRDVKLDNLFLCNSGQVKLIDFGVIKFRGAEGAPRPLIVPTLDGVAIGTPRFFAPEQARGKPIDHRADIYAMGHVLFVLLAGRGPYDHCETLVELAKAHVFREAPQVSTFATQAIAPGLDAIVAKAIAKDPEARYQTAQAFAEALATVALAAPPPPKRSAPAAPSRGGSSSHRAAATLLEPPADDSAPTTLWVPYSAPCEAPDALRLQAPVPTPQLDAYLVMGSVAMLVTGVTLGVLLLAQAMISGRVW